MISSWQVLIIAIPYLLLLFAIAWYGDRRSAQHRPIHNNAIIYSLSLAVYCTSWTFYGAIGQAETQGWQFLSIYVGPIIFLLFFWPILARIIRISKEKRLTSIADFIATRYGRDSYLAILVTCVAVIGIVPYIALQLKAVSFSYHLLTGELGSTPLHTESLWQDTGLYVALIMALFVIVFGTRNLDASEQHPGMMLAIGFESLVKLIAMLAVGIWVVTGLFDQPADIVKLTRAASPEHPLLSNPLISTSFIVQSVLAGFAIICLPRQFQVSVIENTSVQHVQTARWLFPLYLLGIVFFIAPIALAGHLLLDGTGINADSYLIGLPILLNQPELALIAFIGGVSAATGMIIVATISVSTMVSNEWILPIIFRRQQREGMPPKQVGYLVLVVRRIVILLLLIFAYIFYRSMSGFESLASIGLLSFAAISQFAPALFIGLFWQRANRNGAIVGLLGGILTWFQLLLRPMMAGELDFFSRVDLPFISTINGGIDYFTYAVLVSVFINVILFIFISLISKASLREQLTANDFLNKPSQQRSLHNNRLQCRVDDVISVLERVLGNKKTELFLKDYQNLHGVQYNHTEASDELLHESEKLLASIVGSSSANVLFSTLLGGEKVHPRDLTSMASEASNAFAMNREQLQSALEHIHQGISIIDKDFKLIAWNKRYEKLFEYPDNFLTRGKPIEEIIAFNAMRGFCGEGKVTLQVARRMQAINSRSSHHFERILPNGLVLSMQGHPMPDGGFVTSFTDITVHRKAEQALREENVHLERSVEQRSEELDDLTSKLIESNQGKTRFLAATGHDLMQPLNAAKLFAATLNNESLSDHQQHLLNHLQGSLQSAEDVLSLLIEIAKLDAGAVEPTLKPVSLTEVLRPLRDEFTALAAEKGLQLTIRSTDAWVISDAHWLRRIIQNLLSNALRYTPEGRTLIGVRKRNETISLEVWDTGIGIPKDKLTEIFREFKRLKAAHQETKGLGLGLAIVERMSARLDHSIEVISTPGKGSCFRLMMKATPAEVVTKPIMTTQVNQGNFEGLKVLCIDNDHDVLAGMNALISSWGCQVISATEELSATELLANPPDIILADYALDDDENGLDVMKRVRNTLNNSDLPGILITANPQEEVADATREAGFYFLSKPLRPASLRSLMRRLNPNK
ncbi:MAG: PAS domain-containing hybrid sensor histidine kinase/response regulator [Oleibacter sp.]|nr:PAS domain-containing hybrid sensor histidine kinase/response regulator [Thalassolituus sp.]